MASRYDRSTTVRSGPTKPTNFDQASKDYVIHDFGYVPARNGTTNINYPNQNIKLNVVKYQNFFDAVHEIDQGQNSKAKTE